MQPPRVVVGVVRTLNDYLKHLNEQAALKYPGETNSVECVACPVCLKPFKTTTCDHSFCQGCFTKLRCEKEKMEGSIFFLAFEKLHH
jgi:hypothetical protein